MLDTLAHMLMIGAPTAADPAQTWPLALVSVIIALAILRRRRD